MIFRMKQATFSEVTEKVRETVFRSPLADRLSGISVDENDDELGGEFLRVVLEVKGLNTFKLDQMTPLVQSIEDAVAEIDERFASVRLAEAA
ncbi:MAG: hypothetical protein B7Z42_13730 [Brevundimonas sp. 12-68-7]|nr:MAG: hypothetical protein B7Z42_13730 [Brevundimonas sp. 12-68-7]